MADLFKTAPQAASTTVPASAAETIAGEQSYQMAASLPPAPQLGKASTILSGRTEHLNRVEQAAERLKNIGNPPSGTGLPKAPQLRG